MARKKNILTLFLSSSKMLSSSNSFPRSSTPSFPSLLNFNESVMQENIENAEPIITKWNTNSSSTFLFQHREQAKEFLKSVKDLHRAIHFLVFERSASDKLLVLAQNLMQTAMARLEREFYQILSAHPDQLDPESVSGPSSDGSRNFEDKEDAVDSEEEIKLFGELITNVERESTNAMSDLKSIADCMINAGYSKECTTIYKLIRKSIVNEGLYLLGVERFRSSHQVQKMEWEVVEQLIKDWLNAVKVAVKTLFSGEKTLCDHVFSASQTIREFCFNEITKEGATNLFGFPELIAKCKKSSPERIFPLMKLHESLSSLRAEIELIFNFESTSPIKLQALSSLQRLGEWVRAALSQFEATMQKDSSKTPAVGGGIHPLTRTAMNHISSLADYSAVLSDILADSPPSGHTRLPESYFESPTSDDSSTSPAVSLCLARLILVLLCKIDSKTEVYKDVSLSYIFLANNLQFIVHKVCTTRLRLLLGEDWVFKHAQKVRQYASNYEITAWSKVLSSLPEKTSPEVSPEAAKECVRRFNAAFQEEYRKQTSWIIANDKLRNEVKASIARKLAPAYREFYDKYLVMLNGEKNLEMFVRLCPDDLGNYLDNLFHGIEILESFSSSSSRGCVPR